jgi:hypothetical protein
MQECQNRDDEYGDENDNDTGERNRVYMQASRLRPKGSGSINSLRQCVIAEAADSCRLVRS